MQKDEVHIRKQFYNMSTYVAFPFQMNVHILCFLSSILNNSKVSVPLKKFTEISSSIEILHVRGKQI